MTKQEQFAAAMGRYHAAPGYARFRVGVSAAVVTLQAASVALVPWGSLSIAGALLAALAAYLVADFVNGIVHMIMDNTDTYGGIVGPLVAVFHLHHKTPRYTSTNPVAIYVLESGSKHWLVPYLAALVYVQTLGVMPAGLTLALVLVGLLSSFAEVSHYLCHNSTHPTVRLLQRLRLLLPPEHHAIHHTQDNVGYAFLNGLTDPLLDAIARRTCGGYVSRTDKHVGDYQRPK